MIPGGLTLYPSSLVMHALRRQWLQQLGAASSRPATCCRNTFILLQRSECLHADNSVRMSKLRKGEPPGPQWMAEATIPSLRKGGVSCKDYKHKLWLLKEHHTDWLIFVVLNWYLTMLSPRANGGYDDGYEGFSSATILQNFGEKVQNNFSIIKNCIVLFQLC